MDNGGAFTDRLLADAGIARGQAALDVGCGAGDVAFRLAQLVGPSGRAVGVDVSETALARARERAAVKGVANVAFVRADVTAGGLEEVVAAHAPSGFDVATCRRVLMYLPNPVGAVRALVSALRPGGRLALQEHDMSLTTIPEALALNARVHGLIWDAVRAEGADPAIGLKLHGILTEAGAAAPDIRAEAVVATPEAMPPTAAIVAVMAERIIAAGLATRAEMDAMDAATLDARLEAECREVGPFISEAIFGALAQRPHGSA